MKKGDKVVVTYANKSTYKGTIVSETPKTWKIESSDGTIKGVKKTLDIELESDIPQTEPAKVKPAAKKPAAQTKPASSVKPAETVKKPFMPKSTPIPATPKPGAEKVSWRREDNIQPLTWKRAALYILIGGVVVLAIAFGLKSIGFIG